MSDTDARYVRVRSRNAVFYISKRNLKESKRFDNDIHRRDCADVVIDLKSNAIIKSVFPLDEVFRVFLEGDNGGRADLVIETHGDV